MESNTVSSSNSTQRAIAALSLVLACLLLGAVIGLMTAQLFATEPPTDADRQGGASGALIVGGLLGLVAGGYLVRDLSVQARWWSAMVAVVLAAGTYWSLALTTE